MLPTTYKKKTAPYASPTRPSYYLVRMRENQLLMLHQLTLDVTYDV